MTPSKPIADEALPPLLLQAAFADFGLEMTDRTGIRTPNMQPVFTACQMRDYARAALAAAAGQVEQREAQKYDDTLLPFLTLMRKELHANSSKGDRPGWLKMDANTALLEVYWHAAKLSAAVKNNDGPAIMEHSADVANMAMMVADVCGTLAWVEGDK